MGLPIEIGRTYVGQSRPFRRRVLDMSDKTVWFEVPGFLSFAPSYCSIEEFIGWVLRLDEGDSLRSVKGQNGS